MAAFQLAAARDPGGRSAGLVAIGSAVGGTAGLFGGPAIAAAADWRGALVLPLLSLAVLGLVRGAGAEAPSGSPAAVLRSRRFLASAALMLLLSTISFGLMWVVLLAVGVGSLSTAGGQGLLTGRSAEGLPRGLRDTAIGLFNFAFLVGVAAGPALASSVL